MIVSVPDSNLVRLRTLVNESRDSTSKKTDHFIESFALKLKVSGVPIRAEDGASRLAQLEAKLTKRLPTSFGSILSQYSFPSFDDCWHHVVWWESSNNQYIAEASATKGGLSELLRPAGYFQIGRLDTGDFDAICFDMNKSKKNREYPLVRISHEDILCNWCVTVIGELWPSFRNLAEFVLSGADSHIYYEKPCS